jgi:DNA-binding NtrC family response regulator
VLQRGRFRRVGGEGEVEVDVRVVSATNRDLRAEVNRGTFRSDLYYRLAGGRIVVPPLRDRAEDIPLLIAHFANEVHGSGASPPFEPALMKELEQHYWSGNVRELRNAVETALAMGRLDLDSRASPATAQPAGEARHLTTYKEARAQALHAFERDFLARLMLAANGNASEAARLARMDRPYLLSLLRKHALR